MLTRSRSLSRSSSGVSFDDPESTSSSQNTPAVLRQGSSTSSYFDSQDSAAVGEISLNKTATKRKTKELPECNQRVIIAPDAVFSSTESSSPRLVFIPHPRDVSFERLYLLSDDGSVIYETTKCSEEHRSWFIGESVQTDGSMTICTPVDPLFLALPLVGSFKLDKYTTIETLLDFNTNSHARIIADLISEEQWMNICERKALPDCDYVYRYSIEKTMKWLKKKVELLAERLVSDGTCVGVGSQTSGFLQSNKEKSAIAKEEYLHYASGMIGEYLPEDLYQLLLTSYPSICKITIVHDEDDKPPSKKLKTEGSEPLEDYSTHAPQSKSNVKQVSKLTPGLKALKKVDKKGMKSLTSFFGKKS